MGEVLSILGRTEQPSEENIRWAVKAVTGLTPPKMGFDSEGLSAEEKHARDKILAELHPASYECSWPLPHRGGADRCLVWRLYTSLWEQEEERMRLRYGMVPYGTYTSQKKQSKQQKREEKEARNKPPDHPREEHKNMPGK